MDSQRLSLYRRGHDLEKVRQGSETGPRPGCKAGVWNHLTSAYEERLHTIVRDEQGLHCRVQSTAGMDWLKCGPGQQQGQFAGGVWWQTPVIPTPGRWKQEGRDFKVTFDYIVNFIISSNK